MALRAPASKPCPGLAGPSGRTRPTARGTLAVVRAQKVVLVGGTGRVGSSTASSLLDLVPGVELTLAGRTEGSFEACKKRRPELKDASFVSCDAEDAVSVAAAIAGADLVVHTAGPFQQSTNTAVLDAAIASRVPYLDVCDDMSYSQLVKARCASAAEAGVPVITTGGIYPGISNLMAAHMASILRKEYNEDWTFAENPPPREDTMPIKDLTFSYFTAGTGGAGPTILETSFLLAGEDVVTYENGKQVIKPPISGFRVKDFGRGLGRRSTYLYNLPEVESAHSVLDIPTISARFGTDPELWNIGMELLAKLVPKETLQDREKVRGLVKVVDPIVRAADFIAGERVGMLVEMNFADGKNACGLFLHPKLSIAVGRCTASFAKAILAGQTEPGVWFPEEKQALKDRRQVLSDASEGCKRFELNRPKWAIDEEPVQLGMGFYW